MIARLPLMSGLMLALTAGSALAQTAPSPFLGPVLAQDRILSRAIDTLQVSAPAFGPNAVIPLVHTGYGKSTSFAVEWTPGPTGTKAYAVIVEDPDAGQPQPVLHWLAYNIPATDTSLGKSVHTREVIAGAKGLMQGRNSKNGIGYVGPHPPVGDPPHHYHIQVFALSRMLPLGGGADLNQVVAAMNDRVLAEGELVATFEAPKPGDPKPAKPPKS